jgi:hypothetical protein
MLSQLLGNHMPNPDRELAYHSAGAFCDDVILAIACAITECAITFVGPWFWMCLILPFLIEELRT